MPTHASKVSAAGRLALCALFASMPRLAYEMHVHGLDRDPAAPRTFYAMMHKRDMDGMTPVPRVLWHRGWRGLTADVHFAMRSDAFQRGFLSRMVLHPRWVSLLLRPLSVGPLLHGIGVHPLTNLHIRPAEVWIREVLHTEGDLPAEEVLTARFLSELATSVRRPAHEIARLPLSRLLGWRFHLALQPNRGAEIFRHAYRRRAELRAMQAARANLDDIAKWTREGGSLFNGPEGKLSPDGRLSPITSGMYRILRASPPDTRIVPIALMYDFLTTGRARLFMDVAPPIEAAATIPQPELFTALRGAWLSVARFSCTQLAAGLLPACDDAPGGAFTTGELATAVCTQARVLDGAGRNVDNRLLTEGGAHSRVAGFLHAARRRGIVRTVGRDRWQTQPLAEPANVPLGYGGYNLAPLTYARNELDELLGDAYRMDSRLRGWSARAVRE